ncbi:DUF2442 domain-containing protein [candidate division KSB1 bacterium]|nr:DUF2442 domain-containing protein [candidate division KSB1 bacterium]
MKIVETLSQSSDYPVIEIHAAKYIGDDALRIQFNNGFERLVDFKPFLLKSHHPSISKYLDEEKFKQFKIIDGNLNWNDYDLIFPISDLFEDNIN